MPTEFKRIEIGEGFIAYVNGGSMAFIKISARKAKTFINGKFVTYKFSADTIVYPKEY